MPRVPSFERAILHIDGDCFFASIEQAQHKEYRGKAIVTGEERGIATSMSVEAKRLGISRSMPMWDIKKKFPQVIIVPADYEVYSIYSRRMYAIVRRYTPDVEEYSIDECFADLTGLRHVLHMSYREMAMQISEELKLELGVTFSVGLAPTKVLAKLGSKWNKPNGLTVISGPDIETYLRQTPVEKIWNIGPQTTHHLNKLRIHTALELMKLSEETVMDIFHKPMQEMWHELNGRSVWPVKDAHAKKPQSLSVTRTFSPPSTDAEFIFTQLSKNIEECCLRARRHGLVARNILFYLKTHADFIHHNVEIKLPEPTDNPLDIVRVVKEHFHECYKEGTGYRASGVWLLGLVDLQIEQLDLFGNVEKKNGVRALYKEIDVLSEKYGKHTVFLGSSFEALTNPQHVGGKEKVPDRRKVRLTGETAKKRIAVPFIGYTH